MNLIKTLFYCAIKIYSQSKLQSETDFVSKVLVNNGYSLDVVQLNICTKMVQFKKPKLAGP